MRYRALDANGDMRFGSGPSEFLINSPACVGQAVMTRLLLVEGEWFLDTTEGTPWATQILGKNTAASYDPALQARVLETQGVVNIETYASQLDPTTRELSVQMLLNTLYGQTPVATTLSVPS